MLKTRKELLNAMDRVQKEYDVPLMMSHIWLLVVCLIVSCGLIFLVLGGKTTTSNHDYAPKPDYCATN